MQVAMPRTNLKMLTDVREAAEKKRDQLVAYLVAASGGAGISDKELQDTSVQLVDLNARIMTLDYAIGDREVNWGAMMSHLAQVTPGTFKHPDAS